MISDVNYKSKAPDYFKACAKCSGDGCYFFKYRRCTYIFKGPIVDIDNIKDEEE